MKELHKFKFKYKNLNLVFMGDLHLGPTNCDEDLILDKIDYVRKRSNCRLIGMGDFMDLATKTSLGDVYTQKMTPTQQFETLYDWYKPIRHKILLFLAGNHEINRVEKHVNLNPMQILARELGVTYGGYTSLLKLTVRKRDCTVYVTHGRSGATTIGGKINAVLRLARVVDADIYAHAHLHHLDRHIQTIMRVKGNEVEYVNKHFLLTGHFLDYADSYAEKKSYPIGRKGCSRVVIHSYPNVIDSFC